MVQLGYITVGTVCYATMVRTPAGLQRSSGSSYISDVDLSWGDDLLPPDPRWTYQVGRTLRWLVWWRWADVAFINVQLTELLQIPRSHSPWVCSRTIPPLYA